MKNLIVLSFATSIVFMSVGCSNLLSNSIDTNSERLCFKDDGSYYTCEELVSNKSGQFEDVRNKMNPTLFRTNLHFQLLNDYVEQMSLDLSHDLLANNIRPISISAFEYLDPSLTSTDVLSSQLTELFIGNLQKAGVVVKENKIDRKVLRIATSNEELFYDEQPFSALNNEEYVLTGTMIKNDKGVLITARVVGLYSNAVVASTSKLIPNILLDTI